MKIFYIAMASDYGDPRRGPSFEETNFRSALEGMGFELVAYDFMAREQAIGRAAMRREIVAAAKKASPDVVFSCLFTDQLDNATLESLGRATGAPTVNWFADDHWRFEGFTSNVAPALDWCVTTDAESVARYREIGVSNVMLSQWACNRYLYTPPDRGQPSLADVAFVGQPHGDRERWIRAIDQSGIDVKAWGHGWPAGRLSHEEMVRVFGTSPINLNLANASVNDTPKTMRARVGKLLGRGPKGAMRPQIKGRTFEIPGCGGFELTERVPGLERYFELDSEIAVYDDLGDLIEQCYWWLDHAAERNAVAEAGYRRVMAEHTYDHRFEEIFATMGLT